MPECKQCGKAFSIRQFIHGRERIIRKRVYCLDCVPFVDHNTRADQDETNGLSCIDCETPLTGSRKKYCPRCEQGTNTNAFSKQKQRAKERKIELVKLSGGCCQLCGYNRNAAALTFHHLKDKSFNLDSRNIANRAWDVVVAETKKCQLLCLNCHMEHHHQED
jgi:hypothetical protein